jgi:phage head maturation protease
MAANDAAVRRWRKSERSGFIVAPFEVKERDESKRTFGGALSTSHLDLGNGYMQDIVHPGAFKRWARTLKAGAYVPMLDSHDWFSIMNVYGHLLDAEERQTGVMLEYELEGGKKIEVEEMYLDTMWQVIDGPDGDRVFDRLRPGSVRKMSMGYEPLRFDFGTLANGKKLRNLREVKVEEGSLVVFAMQPNAEVDPDTLKALAGWASDAGAGLTAEQRARLVATFPELKELLSPETPTDPTGGEVQPPVGAETAKGLQPDDPRRLAAEAAVRDLLLTGLRRHG